MKTNAVSPFIPRRRSGHCYPAWFIFLAAALLLAGLWQPAQAAVLLAEDFNDNAAIYTGVFDGGATPNAINIRPESNIINTDVDNGFDSFFGTGTGNNLFLVIGDDEGGIDGPPSGLSAAGIGPSSFALFSLGSFGIGTHSLDISFDFAFDTNGDAPIAGFFSVSLIDDGFAQLQQLLLFSDLAPNQPNRRGTFSLPVDLMLASATDVHLAFGLAEFPQTTSSVLGVDNILVQSVPPGTIPEPGSLALLSLGLFGLGFARRSKA